MHFRLQHQSAGKGLSGCVLTHLQVRSCHAIRADSGSLGLIRWRRIFFMTQFKIGWEWMIWFWRKERCSILHSTEIACWRFACSHNMKNTNKLTLNKLISKTVSSHNYGYFHSSPTILKGIVVCIGIQHSTQFTTHCVVHSFQQNQNIFSMARNHAEQMNKSLRSALLRACVPTRLCPVLHDPSSCSLTDETARVHGWRGRRGRDVQVSSNYYFLNIRNAITVAIHTSFWATLWSPGRVNYAKKKFRAVMNARKHV